MSDSIARLRAACGTNPEELDGLLSAVADLVVDLVQLDDRDDLADALSGLRASLTLFRANLTDQPSPSQLQLQGKLESLVVIVASAKVRHPSRSFRREMLHEGNIALIEFLADSEMTLDELTAKLGAEDRDSCYRVAFQVSRLDRAGVVITSFGEQKIYVRLSQNARRVIDPEGEAPCAMKE